MQRLHRHKCGKLGIWMYWGVQKTPLGKQGFTTDQVAT